MRSTPHALVLPSTSGTPNPVLYPLRPHQEAELARLGFRPSDFHAFVNHFVGHRFNYIVRGLSDSSWRSAGKQLLSNGHLISHLAGERWLGTGARWDGTLGAKGRHVTSYMIIDLDFDGDMDQFARQSSERGAASVPEWQDLLQRYDNVCRVLGSPSIVFRSSASGGLHLYYLLTHTIELHELWTPCGDKGAVVRLLRGQGLDVSPGRLEVYPRGQYRMRGQKNRVRLPFGLGSMALDPHTLDRLTTGTPLDDLRLVLDRLAAGMIPLIDPEFWTTEAANMPAKRRSTSSKAKRSRRASTADHMHALDVASLWRDGLSGPRQLNDALWALSGDLRRRGVSVGEAQERLSNWLDRKHNGCSRTYNASLPIAHQEVEEVVARRFALAGHDGGWGNLPGLSEWEAASVIAATSHDHQLADPQTGELLSRFKVQYLGFELLRRNKQWVLRELRWRIADLVGGVHSSSTAVLNEATLLPLVASFWPDVSQPRFIVPVPYRLRLTIPGVGKNSHWAYWRALQAAKLYQVGRRASADAHRAASYHVALDFGAFSARAAELQCLEAAVKRLLKWDEIRALYSRYYRQRIVCVCQPQLPPPEDFVVATIQRLLRDGSGSLAAA